MSDIITAIKGQAASVNTSEEASFYDGRPDQKKHAADAA